MGPMLLFLTFVAVGFCAGAGWKAPREIHILKGRDFDKTVRGSGTPWMVLFYAPWCGHCKNFKPEFFKAAKGLGGLVNLAMVNCDEEKDVAQRFGIQGFPTIKIFLPGKKKPVDYRGGRTAKAVHREMMKQLKKLPDPVAALGPEEWIEEGAAPTVLLMTSKADNPILFKSLALDFAGTFEFAFKTVIDGDVYAAQEKYAVKSVPKIVVIGMEGKGIIPYEGAVRKDDIAAFLDELTGGKRSNRPPPSDEPEKKKPTKTPPPPRREPPKPPKPVDAEVLKDLAHYAKKCEKMCVVAVPKTDEAAEQYRGIVADVSKSMKHLKWLSDPNGVIPELDTLLPDGDGLPLVVIRLKRKKYVSAVVKDDDSDAAGTFFERVMYGNIKYAALPEKFLPPKEDEVNIEEEVEEQAQEEEKQPDEL